MTKTPTDRFCDDTDMSPRRAARVSALAAKAARANEGECNGDPHPRSPDRADKTANAAAWGRELAELTHQIEEAVAPFGLTVEYTGLRPCLRDAAGKYLEIPA